jgi:3-deoxy-D-manno-octulosonic-acid transferase
MARAVYSLLFTLAMPLIWLRLLWRARRQPEYLHHLGERHGFYAPRPTAPLIWLHAVSVGETRAAEPLIAALLERYPGHALLLTHMTPTGRATGRALLEPASRTADAGLPALRSAGDRGAFSRSLPAADRPPDGDRIVAQPA